MELQEPKYFTQGGSRILVNPNPGTQYAVQYAGKKYVFDGLQPMHMPGGIAGLLVIKAEKHFAEAKEDAKNQRAAFEHLIKLGGSSRIKALDFVDEKGNPRTKVWPLIPLIDITNDPSILDRLELAESEEDKIDLANRLHHDFMAKEKTADAIAGGIENTKAIAAPLERWIKDGSEGKTALMNYISAHAGRCGAAEHVSKLYEKAMALYDNEVELLKSVGVAVVEPSPEDAE